MKIFESFIAPKGLVFLQITSCCFAITLLLGEGSIAHADILYDTTSMSESGTWDNGSYMTYIGGAPFLGYDVDVQATDDFDLKGTYTLTSVTADYGTVFGSPPAEGVLIEFFEDLGGYPHEVPIAQVLSAEFTATPIDIQHPVIVGLRLTVDLANDDITLPSGTWWISITPVDPAPDGSDLYNQLSSTAGVWGNNTHVRSGGIDHGNGLPGGYGGAEDWTLAGGLAAHPYADIAMKIEGTLVVKPSCPQDLDESGAVGTSDLLILFSQWGTDGSADFDKSGAVGTSDLLILFANWGPCPK